MSAQEFVARWGKEDLVPVPASILQYVGIPSADKDFLTEKGLPHIAAIPTGGAGDFHLLSFEALSTPDNPTCYLLSPYRQSYLLLGFIGYEPEFGHETYFCVERMSGVIRLLDNRDTNAYFVNSSIPTFAETLLAYRTFLQPGASEPLKDNDDGRLRRLKHEIKTVDPKAMASRTNYWPLMLADLANQI